MRRSVVSSEIACLFALGLWCLLASPAFALQTNSTSNASVLPLVLTGKQLQPLLGESLLRLSAFTCAAGKAKPLLFQVDEVNADGRIVSSEASGGKGVAPDESPGVFDENDEFVVMLKDLEGECGGEQLSRVKGKLVSVRVGATFLKEPAYLYILSGERGFVPSASYVEYRAADNRVVTPGYGWGYLPDKPPITAFMSFRDLQGRGDENVVDRLKVRFNIRALRSLVRLRLDEEDLEYSLDGVRVGPVRVTREVTVTVKTVPGFTLKAFARYEHYERLWRGGVRFKVPAVAALFLTSMDVTFAHDFLNLRGLTLSTSGLAQGALVDGTMIEQERSIAFGPEPWYFVSGGGLNQVTALDLEKGLNLKGAALFVDDPEYDDPPEASRGGLPLVGYQFLGWENLQARWYTFGANVALLPGFPEGGATGFYRTLRAPFDVKAGEVQAGPGQGP